MKKKAALYNPYLDVLGGGERHILSILKVLEDKGYEINIFWDKDLNNPIKERLNVSFKNKLVFLPNVFKKRGSLLDKSRTLKQFEIFFYVTDGSYFFSQAKKNFIFSMVPNKKLYRMNFLNKLKTYNFQFISNSNFTQSILLTQGVKSEVIYPFLENDYLNADIDSLKKDRIILSVGRFFKHLHSKRQDVAIDLFKKIKQKIPLLKDFKLILAGGLKEEDRPYLNELIKNINGEPSIILKTNQSYDQLLELYKRSLIYWHVAGYGIDEEKHPEQTEHLGITPLEAMATGNLTFGYSAGGLKEIIQDGENGFLFKTEGELFEKMMKVLNNQTLQLEIKSKAKAFVIKNFSYEVFARRILEVIG